MDLSLAKRAALAAILAAAAILFLVPSSGAAKQSDKAKLTERQAIAIAARDAKVRREVSRYPKAKPQATFKPPSWQVDYYLGSDDLVQVTINDANGKVTESWTGYQVEWKMARGYPGAFGRRINAPYVWIPLCLIFLAGLADWRRPWRIANLDLLALLAFGVSHFFFNRADIGLSVPLAYPVLLYLLARMLWVGFRGPGEGLRPTAPVAWLAVGTLFLLGVRIGLNVTDANVIDVGYSGVIGADRLMHGLPLYGHFPSDNPFGDTYGPFAYYAYIPFELIWPWHGTWDDLPAAHGAAVTFDLLTVGGLFLLGRRLRPGRRGEELGVILAFAWAAFPYTAFALESNSNDSLVAVLVVAALLVVARPLARGATIALAAATKFAPLLLAPLFAFPRGTDPVRGDGESGRPAMPVADLAIYAGGFAIAAGLVMLSTALDPGLGKFYDRTLGFQASRGSPFSVWGQEPSLEWLQTAIKVGVAGLALLVAFVPRRRTVPQLAALAAAVLIAAQLTAEHWFYLYIVWFFPLVAVALAAGEVSSEPASSPARSSPPARLAGSRPPPP